MNPILSFVLPSLNVAPYIEECLNSILIQPLQDIEIICVDAGSTDGTLNIINKMAKYDARISVIVSGRKSYGYQVNLGISKSVGNYVCIVETDDYVMGDIYALMTELAEAHDLDYIKAGFNMMLPNGKDYYLVPFPVFPETMEKLYDNIVSPQDNLCLHRFDTAIWSGIYRRKFLLNNNIYVNESDGASFQDIGFVHRVLCSGKKAYYLRELFYQYRIAREEASTKSVSCVRFLKQEYSLLLEPGIHAPDNQMTHLPGMMIRLAISLRDEINKILKQADYNIRDHEVYEHYMWCRKILCDAIQRRIIQRRDFLDVIWKDLRFLLDDPDSYANMIRIRDKDMEDYISEIKNELNYDEVIICTSGNKGGCLALKLIQNGIVVRSFADNSKTKQGTVSHGVPVISMEEASQERGIDFCIPDSGYAFDILRQLRDANVPEKLIHIL